MEDLVGSLEENFNESVKNFYSWFRYAKDVITACTDTSGDDVTTLEEKLDVSLCCCVRFSFKNPAFVWLENKRKFESLLFFSFKPQTWNESPGNLLFFTSY